MRNRGFVSTFATSTLALNDAGQVTVQTAPILGNGEAPQVTTTFYDNMGRMTGTRQPDGTTSTNIYFPTGLLQLTRGTRTYPVEYTYDAQGRLLTMKTWQNYTAGTAAFTGWDYDQYRGWLSGKRFADPTSGNLSSTGVVYAYTPGGRLDTRTWARGVVTHYTYGFGLTDEDPGHGDLLSVSYTVGGQPEGTPATWFAYDRLGQRQAAGNGLLSTAFFYNDAGQLLTERHNGGILNGISVNAAYNSSLQRESLKLTNGTTEWQIVASGYDSAGRLQTVNDGSHSATYAYLKGSVLNGP